MLTASNKQHQRGFTLIELVVVIVIIGILAAFAIPRFANIARDARFSSLNGLAGTLRSGAALIHGLSLARNIANGDLPMEGVPAPGVAVVNGYPAATAAGITATIGNFDPATYIATPGAGTMVYAVNGGGANCNVTYTAAGVGGVATILVNAGAALTDGTGC